MEKYRKLFLTFTAILLLRTLCGLASVNRSPTTGTIPTTGHVIAGLSVHARDECVRKGDDTFTVQAAATHSTAWTLNQQIRVREIPPCER